MKKLLLSILILISCSIGAAAQKVKILGVAQRSNTVIVSGINSSTKAPRTFPLSTVTILNSDNSTATIYSDLSGTIKSNPMTADANAEFDFFIAPGAKYSVRISGTGVPVAFTRSGYTAPPVGTFDVKTFGALCDGTSVDTVAIAAANTAAVAVGSQITIPNGTCVVNTITIGDAKFEAGGKLSINSGQTLTVGKIDAPPGKVLFAGAGTVSVATQTVRTDWFPGADKGLQITAASTALGWNDGKIIVEGGGNISSATLGKRDIDRVNESKAATSAKRVLDLGPGNWQLTGYNAIKFNSNVEIAGAGRGITRILECSSCASSNELQFFMLLAEGQALLNGETYSNVHVHDLDLIGTRGDFGSAASALMFANGHHVKAERIGFFNLNAIGIQAGASSVSSGSSPVPGTDAFGIGRYADDVLFHDLYFTGQASQHLALTNYQNVQVSKIRSVDSGQAGGPSHAVIDIEPNASTDRALNLTMSDIDISNPSPLLTTNAIAYQPGTGAATNYGGFTLTNFIIRGKTSGVGFTSNGLIVAQAKGAAISNGYIDRQTQSGLVLSGNDVTATNIQVIDSGTGGIPAVNLLDLTNSSISNITVRNPTQGTPDFAECGTNSNNRYFDNKGFLWTVGDIRCDTFVSSTGNSYANNYLVNPANSSDGFADHADSVDNTLDGNTTRTGRLILVSATSKILSHRYYDPSTNTANFAVGGQIISTLPNGTAPFVTPSSTQVTNFNASFLGGNTFAIPGTIGSTTPNTGAFTTLTSTGGAFNGTVGATTPGTGAFTTLGISGGHFTLNPFSAGATAELRMLERAVNGTNYVWLKAPDSIATTFGWTLPGVDGTNGQVLQTNGAGVFSWTANAATGMSNVLTTEGGMIIASNTAAPSTPIELLPGTPGQVLTMGAVRPEWGAGGGASTPCGSDTQVQFNNAGVCGGDAAFAWNNTSKALTLSTATVGTYTPLMLRNTNNGTGSSAGSQLGNDIQQDALVFKINSSTFTSENSTATIYNRLNGAMAFGTNNTERFRLSAAGPATFTSTLDVAGHQAIGATATIDQITGLSNGPQLLNVRETLTTFTGGDGKAVGIFSYYKLDPNNAQPVGFEFFGGRGIAEIVAGNTQIYSGDIIGQGGHVYHGGTNSLAAGTAIWGEYAHFGTGTTTSGRGVLGQAKVTTGGAGGTVTALFGVMGQVLNQVVATVSNARGLQGYISNTAAGTITDAATIQAATPVNSGGGTIGKITGLRIQDHSGIGATTHYNIESLGVNSFNLFEGIVRGPIQDKGGQVFNVKSYGALGDGVTDDHAAIVLALTAAEAAGGGVVFFPPVTDSYINGSVITVTGDNITFQGVGLASVWEAAPGMSPAANQIVANSTNGLTARDMKFVGNGTTTGGAGGAGQVISAQFATNVTVENVWMTNFVGIGVALLAVDGARFHRNSFVDMGESAVGTPAIWISGYGPTYSTARVVSITENYFEDCKWQGVNIYGTKAIVNYNFAKQMGEGFLYSQYLVAGGGATSAGVPVGSSTYIGNIVDGTYENPAPGDIAAGIEIFDNDSVVIGNILTNLEGDGIRLGNGSHRTVIGNTISNANSTPLTITVVSGTDVFTATGYVPVNGQEIRPSNYGGQLPAPLFERTAYFIRDSSGATFKLAATLGGAAIDITTTGTGTSFIRVPSAKQYAGIVVLQSSFATTPDHSFGDVISGNTIHDYGIVTTYYGIRVNSNSPVFTYTNISNNSISNVLQASCYVDSDRLDGVTNTFEHNTGCFNGTITAGGTTGAQTINKPRFSVNFAAAASSLVVTNSLISTTSSIVTCSVSTNDTTLKSVSAVKAAGSVTLVGNAAATAETRVDCRVEGPN